MFMWAYLFVSVAVVAVTHGFRAKSLVVLYRQLFCNAARQKLK
jgi:hypothetical protein